MFLNYKVIRRLSVNFTDTLGNLPLEITHSLSIITTFKLLVYCTNICVQPSVNSAPILL